jgi:hypothetical protein
MARMNYFATEDHVEWEMIHGYVRDIGGFVVDFSGLLSSELELPTADNLCTTVPNMAISLSRGGILSGK